MSIQTLKRGGKQPRKIFNKIPYHDSDSSSDSGSDLDLSGLSSGSEGSSSGSDEYDSGSESENEQGSESGSKTGSNASMRSLKRKLKKQKLEKDRLEKEKLKEAAALTCSATAEQECDSGIEDTPTELNGSNESTGSIVSREKAEIAPVSETHDGDDNDETNDDGEYGDNDQILRKRKKKSKKKKHHGEDGEVDEWLQYKKREYLYRNERVLQMTDKKRKIYDEVYNDTKYSYKKEDYEYCIEDKQIVPKNTLKNIISEILEEKHRGEYEIEDECYDIINSVMASEMGGFFETVNKLCLHRHSSEIKLNDFYLGLELWDKTGDFSKCSEEWYNFVRHYADNNDMTFENAMQNVKQLKAYAEKKENQRKFRSG